MLVKVLTAIIAEDVSHLVEKHQLLPANHFEGRPGRTTTDALHYLVYKIKDAWRKGKVASLLFLDMEGAFPNAVTDRLIHNLRKHKIPEAYVDFVHRLLDGRKTRLKFNDFISELMDIRNGIGQGNPFSMLLYILFNADLLECLALLNDEDAIGYVDDAMAIAFGNNFEETTTILKRMMTRDVGGFAWSLATTHASKSTNSSYSTSVSDYNKTPKIRTKGFCSTGHHCIYRTK